MNFSIEIMFNVLIVTIAYRLEFVNWQSLWKMLKKALPQLK